MQKCVMFGGMALILALFAVSPAAAADSCTATKSCPIGTNVTCHGTSSCVLGSDYAECDGIRSPCPTTATMCSASYECLGSPYTVACSGPEPCSSDPSSRSVTCGNTTLTCAGCEAQFNPRLSCFHREVVCGEVSSCTSHSQCGDGFCSSQGTCICR
ncbi:MAG TPA: hypothetical protein VIW92_15030 [Thermoanaerobaculia bacterium]